METHQDVDILGGIIKVMNRNELMFSIIPAPKTRTVRMIFENAGIAHPSAMYRRESFEGVSLRYDTTLQGSEDYRLWAEACIKGLKIDSISDIIIHYRMSNNQASRKFADQMLLWDNETKKMLRERVVSLSDYESKVCDSFGKSDEIPYTSRDYYVVFKRIIEANMEKKVYDNGLLKKEFVWQWVKYALYQFRKYKNYSLIVNRFFWNVLKPPCFIYCYVQAKSIMDGKRLEKKLSNTRIEVV